jgi:hypothetical protein
MPLLSSTPPTPAPLSASMQQQHILQQSSQSYSHEKPIPQSTIVEEPELIADPQDEMLDIINVANAEAIECILNEKPQQQQNETSTSPPLLSSTIANIVNSFDITSPTENLPTSTFDYLYEFSETRKVLEEFFKCPDDKIKEFEKFSDFNESDDSLVSRLHNMLERLNFKCENEERRRQTDTRNGK